MTVPKLEISQSKAVFIVLRYQAIDLIWLRYHAQLAEFGYRGYLIDLFGSLRQHIRRVLSSHGSYFGETQSSQNTHGETMDIAVPKFR